MESIRIHGSVTDVLREATAALRRHALGTVVLPLLGYSLLAIGVDRWFLAFSQIGLPSVAVGSSVSLLMMGTAALMHLSQLMLEPAVTVPASPPLSVRGRRLARVALVESALFLVIGGLVAFANITTDGALASAFAHASFYAGSLSGIHLQSTQWTLCWTLYMAFHIPTTSWLWPGVATNYPSGTLRATASLASRVGRATLWLPTGIVGLTVLLIALTATTAEWGVLALAALVWWPAVANAAAARIGPA